MAQNLESGDSNVIAAQNQLDRNSETGLDLLKQGRNFQFAQSDTATQHLGTVTIDDATTSAFADSAHRAGQAAAVAALGLIAERPDLYEKLSHGKGQISKSDLERSMAIDGSITAGKYIKTEGANSYFSDKTEQKAVRSLYDNWSQLNTESVSHNTVYKLNNKFENVTTGGTTKDQVAPEAKPEPPPADSNKKETPPTQYHNDNSSLPSAQLKEVAESIFDKIDSNHDGFLSKEELAKAIQNKSFKGQEAQAVAAMYKTIDMMQNLSDDEWGCENDGITRNDLREYDKLDAQRQGRLNQLGDAANWVNTRFGAFDKDHNNKLSADEIDKALADKSLNARDRQMLNYLKKNTASVAASHGDGEWFWETKEISKEDVNAHLMEVLQKGDAAQKVGSTSYYIDRTQSSQGKGISRALFADRAHPEKSVTPDAIRQGQVGDCYFLASLAAVAKSDPESIVKMIRQNKDGSYTVTFPGDPTHPITVQPPTDAELGLYNAGHSTGTWASVIEKAYGKYLHTVHGKSGLTDAEGADGGGWPADSLKTLTGRNFQMDNTGSMSKAQLVKMMTDNFASGNGKPMSVITPPEGPFWAPGQWSKDGFRLNHAYSVVGFKPDGKGGGMVVIRNPWGGSNNTTSGTIEVPVEKFQKNFDRVVHQK